MHNHPRAYNSTLLCTLCQLFLPVKPESAAFERISAVRPAWTGLAGAQEAVGLGPNTVLHAGPPFEPGEDIPKPVANAAAVAAVFEGWADSLDEGHALIAAGDVNFQSAQDFGVVTPLAAVVSGSMRLQIVEDLSGDGLPAYAPLNGGMQNDLRFGVADVQTLERLRFLNDTLAAELGGTLREPVALMPIADSALARGDDCHGKTANATQLLNAIVSNRFLTTADSFFLNLWMAASKCIMSSAKSMPDSALVTTMAANGSRFGIQIAGLPDHWHTAPATPPLMQAQEPGSPLNAIGDSAIVETLGLGGMCQASAASVLKSPDHFGFSARSVVSQEVAPLVSLGVLDAGGQAGMLGRGLYRPPLEIFEKALVELTDS